MRDQRAVIVQQTLMILVRHGVDREIINEVKTRLEVELSKCEVYERCTDVATVDTQPFHYLNEFLAIKTIEGKSEKTIERYRYEISKLLWYFHKPIEEYTTNDFRVYLDFRKRNGVKKDQLSNRTLDNMAACYRSFFSWLTSERIITWNPCIPIGRIKYKKSVRKHFSQVDLQRLREACVTERDIAMVDLLSSTGCRVGEISKLRISDIDWSNRSFTVVGKGNKERMVYFTEVAAMHLRDYLNTRNDQCVALFVSRTGSPLTVSGIQQAIKRIGKRAMVKDTHCHRFRHTLATNLVTKMPITDVAEILGHDNISTTQGYCHSNNDSVRSEYRRAMA